MTDRPILFSASMVAALLAGRKTETRRLFKPRGFEFYTHPVSGDSYSQFRPYRDGTWDHSRIVGGGPMQAFGWGEGLYSYLPYAPGDRLWVKETYRFEARWDDCKPSEVRKGSPVYQEAAPYEAMPECAGICRPSIFMPRWASRLTLTVTDVRVERLQDCSEEDAIAEGIELRAPADGEFPALYGLPDPNGISAPTAVHAYATLWGQINTDPGKRWADNPWIVAVSFTVEQRNIDA